MLLVWMKLSQQTRNVGKGIRQGGKICLNIQICRGRLSNDLVVESRLFSTIIIVSTINGQISKLFNVLRHILARKLKPGRA